MGKKRELDYAELKEEYNRLVNENQLLRTITYLEKSKELQTKVNELTEENTKLKRIEFYQKRKIRELTLLLLAKIRKLKEKK